MHKYVEIRRKMKKNGVKKPKKAKKIKGGDMYEEEWMELPMHYSMSGGACKKPKGYKGIRHCAPKGSYALPGQKKRCHEYIEKPAKGCRRKSPALNRWVAFVKGYAYNYNAKYSE